jgi:hypothetical protein
MSAQREELLRLVEELPEAEVPAVLDDVRRHLCASRTSLGLRLGSAPGKTARQTWRSGPRSCSTTGSASGVILCDTCPGGRGAVATRRASSVAQGC